MNAGQNLEWKGRYGRIAVATALLLGTTAVFVVIGAKGPKSSQGTYHTMYTCIVPSAPDILRNPATSLVDEQSCEKIGRKLDIELEEKHLLKHYPLENVVFFTQIPFIKDQVMSREFEFLLTDIGMHFAESKYLKEMTMEGANQLNFEVALGYRNAIRGPWKRKVSGNVTRMLSCGFDKHLSGLYSCDHFPLFELGSCHHKQYIVNIFFPSFPLSHLDHYKGLSQVQRLSLYEIHQSLHFTRLWLLLKSIFCPLSLLALLWYSQRLLTLTRVTDVSEGPSLVERFLAFLGTCLVFFNAPFQYLSLYFDLPWLLVLSDFQQGLFISALFGFWIVFVSEHGPDTEARAGIGRYWKQMGVVLVASVFMFVYEFCERGIQALFPFYSLWSNKMGVTIAWTFISVASLSALLYLFLFLATLARVLRALRKKQSELASLTPSAQQRFAGLFGSLRFFLVTTTVVAVCSVLTVVLPSEVMLHHWQHNREEYNVYSGILTGNYGMWNAYCLIMMWMYAPSISMATSPAPPRGQSSQNGAGEDKPVSLQKMLAKKSQS